jgi:tight adherence protein C
MRADLVAALALALAALALLLLAALVLAKLAAARRSERTLVHALDERAQQSAVLAAASAVAQRGDAATNAADKTPKAARATGLNALLERLAHTGIRWLDTPFGRQLVAPEDRRMLEQCGFVDTRARGLFLIARIGCAACLPLLAGTIAGGQVVGQQYFAMVICALIAGFMLPKLFIQRRASARRRSVIDELPMLVDLLRLLQGVGLSIDQSLQVMVSDFRGVLPVLSSELEIAQRQFATGRTREQSLQRLASSYGNEDLRAVVRLLVQVDRHGGAVQEPLKQFGERLRETRRAMLRERIGRLAVKMTGVMIMTLLPALLIVTAGPGVLSITHSLSLAKR